MAVKPNDSDKRPGDCSYGPSINLVNVNIMRGKVGEQILLLRRLGPRGGTAACLGMTAGSLKHGVLSCGPTLVQARTMCRTWWYERSVSTPKNLYEAQYRLRRARQQKQH